VKTNRKLKERRSEWQGIN